MENLTVIKQQLPEIVLNFDEMKAGLGEMLGKYESLIVTEETLKDCKDVQQELSRTRRDIDSKRLEIQREIKKPLDDLNGQMKELMGMVCAVEDPIKKGMQVFEDKRIEDKRNIVRGIIMEANIAHSLRSEFSHFPFDNKWLNKGTTETLIKEQVELIAVSLRVDQDARDGNLSAIGVMVSGTNKTMVTPLNLCRYERMINEGQELSSVIDRVNSDAEHTRQAEAAATKKAEEKIAEKAEAPAPIVTPSAPPPKKVDEPARTVSFSITETEPRIKALAEFMAANGIKWTKINV